MNIFLVVLITIVVNLVGMVFVAGCYSIEDKDFPKTYMILWPFGLSLWIIYAFIKGMEYMFDITI